MKKVIDGDNMVCLEQFTPKETETIFQKYKNDGTWDDVSIDNDGDIILFLEITD